MIRKRTNKEVRRYDIIKLSILLLFLVLIFLMLLRDNDSSTVATTGEEAISSEVSETATPDAAKPDATDEEAYPLYDDSSEQEDDAVEDADPADGDDIESEDITPEAAEPMLLTPAQGDELESGPITFSGTGEPDSSVRILADGSELGQTTVDASGNWYLEVNMEAGEPVIELQSIDSDGNVIGSAPPLALEIVAAAPVVIKPDLVLNESNLYAGNVELSGSGEPGLQVAVIVDGDEVGTVEVTEEGTWNLQVEVEAGDPTISLQTVDENSDILNEAGPFEVTVQAEILPTVALPPDDVFAGAFTLRGTGQPGTQVQLYANTLIIGVAEVDADGNYTIELEKTAGRYNIDVATLDRSGNALEIVPALSLPVLALTSPEFAFSDLNLPEFDALSGLISWSGTADPEALLALVVDGEMFAQTSADNFGNWDLQTDLEPGTYEVSLNQLDSEGNIVSESDPSTVEFERKLPILELPDYSISDINLAEDSLRKSIILPAGDFDWTGQSEPDETVSVIIDGEVVGTATADANGNWVITTGLESGDHEIQIGTVDVDGNINNQSLAMDLNVADMNLPTLETPQFDDSGKGSINGTADPDTIVTVTANGKVVGLTTPDLEGSWTLNVDLGTGSFDLQVQIVDQEGDVVLSSAKQTVKLGATTEPVEANDVINVAAAQGEFLTLLDGLEATGLTDQLSNNEEPFTLFAPTDAAFEALPGEVIMAWNEDPEAYREVLSYLVLDGAYTIDELIEAQVLTTLVGTNIGITTDDDDVLINDALIEASITAGNSIVHAIDQVILPPLGYQAQPPIIDISGVSIFTGDFLTVVGTAEPGATILLQVGGVNFGELVTVDDAGFWSASDDISSGVHEIVAYMLDENGLLQAISQAVDLPVQ